MNNFNTPLIPKEDLPKIVMPKQNKTPLVIEVSDNVSDNWILATGFWNDNGIWIDSDFWID